MPWKRADRKQNHTATPIAKVKEMRYNPDWSRDDHMVFSWSWFFPSDQVTTLNLQIPILICLVTYYFNNLTM